MSVQFCKPLGRLCPHYQIFTCFLMPAIVTSKMSGTESAPEKNGHHKPQSEVRNEVLELNARRIQIENEIKEYQAILRSQGVGMDEPLVDNEGFPRNDIDINQVRLARNRIICLTNDIRGIMKQIEDKLSDYFVKE